jgi:hypothetical protein
VELGRWAVAVAIASYSCVVAVLRGMEVESEGR